MWPAGPDDPGLEAGLVHVWAFELDRPAPVRNRLRDLLAPDELRSVARIRLRRPRRRRLVCRGRTRELLGRHLRTPPAALSFRRGPHGKPSLVPPWSASDLRFNVSRSGGLALLAVVRGVDVGVDVERVRPLPDLEPVASRFFSPGEARRLRRLPPSLRLDAFYRAWTRKEAFLKARGEGLTRSLAGFEVTVEPGRAPRILRIDGPDEPDRWILLHLAPAPGYVGAVALPVPGIGLRRWTA